MTKSKITPLEQIWQERPNKITFEQIEKLFEKADISFSRSTFERDRKANPGNIPHQRLQVYAGAFDCEVSDLIERFVKVRPIVKTTLARKAGIKTT